MLQNEHKKIAAIECPTTVTVTGPEHLCAVQIATRQFCRAIEFNEGAVFDAIIGVSEMAHRILIEKTRGGKVKLCAVKMKGGYALEAQVNLAESGFKEPSAANRMTFRGNQARA
jgi:hypothetical protein